MFENRVRFLASRQRIQKILKNLEKNQQPILTFPPQTNRKITKSTQQ